jgi:hypothetical protein
MVFDEGEQLLAAWKEGRLMLAGQMGCDRLFCGLSRGLALAFGRNLVLDR